MNILVTGSNGFIGRNVCEYLKEKGHYVIGLGRRESSLPEVDEYVRCDISDDALLDIIKDGKVKTNIDAVIHLAADMRKDPYTVQVVATNCGGTERLLQFCRQNTIGIFLQLSSLPVIGKPKQHPITEEHPLDPYTTYHVTKIAEEMLAQFATKAYGIRTASFRISAPIGKGVNPNTIFPTFVRKAIAGETLTLTGKGTRQQTYVHTYDIAQALECALHRKEAQGVYNLGSHNRLSNYSLAKTVIDVIGSESKIEFLDKEDGMDDYIWDVSLEKIQKDIGYEPEITIEEAIKEYAGYLRES